MKRLIQLTFLLFVSLSFSQSEEIADDYFKRGDFEKAMLAYQKLMEKEPGNYKYTYKLIESYQQLEKYQEVQDLLVERIERSKNPSLVVELGYNYQLRDSLDQANKFYRMAIADSEANPIYSYNVAKQFEDHSLLDEAIEVYKIAMRLNPNQNFNIQLARIYGEQGNIEEMFSSYMEYTESKPEFLNNTKRAFSEFISESSDNENNQILKKLLLKKLQLSPDTYWYDLLSWLFVQEKDYNKSFTQEKALYMRNPESLNRLIELGVTTVNEGQDETAKEIFNYIVLTSQDIGTKLTAHQYLLDIDVSNAKKKDYPEIDARYQALFNEFGKFEQTVPLQISYGHFVAFYLKDPDSASKFLKESLKLNLSGFQQAVVKMKLGDILVMEEKFNEGLIYYSQIQANLKNSSISQEARFKVARTSYFKGDFDWAESQLKILKASTSQLIANDALELKLLISDNKYEDSLHVALNMYAKADLLAFQNRKEEAVVLLEQILTEHKGESIEDQALYKQARLFEEDDQVDKAIINYQKIIANYADDILADDAYYRLGNIYNYNLKQPEKAKEYYEKIIFEHEDSIFYVDTRKKYRMLRGDDIN
ncbi:Tetratricopeptide repeat-containing protein [Flavobacteriaceae bacterium MAR_2010_188]|nr:Tetratricopeptide repeat-containing protein [Flavobacteriaceae bacterium MAR_2010_188]